MLSNVLMLSEFRQTSKLGLEFFRSQNISVVFQNADCKGRTFLGRIDTVLKANSWKKGYVEDETSNSPTAYCEMLRGKSLDKQDVSGEWTDIRTGRWHSTSPTLDVNKMKERASDPARRQGRFSAPYHRAQIYARVHIFTHACVFLCTLWGMTKVAMRRHAR